MSLADLKDLAATIQSLVLSAAVIIGGVWALYRFLSLKSIDKARAELDQVRKSLIERGTLNIAMSSSILADPVTSDFYIHAAVSVTNVGSRTEVIDSEKVRLEAARVGRDSEGQITFADATAVTLQTISEETVFDTIDPAQTIQYQFVVPVSQDGVYLLEFSAPSSPREIERTVHEAAGVGEKAEAIIWSSSLYVQVDATGRKTTTA